MVSVPSPPCTPSHFTLLSQLPYSALLNLLNVAFLLLHDSKMCSLVLFMLFSIYMQEMYVLSCLEVFHSKQFEMILCI